MALLLPVMPVFGKGSKNTDIPITAEEQANAETAAKSWNHYVETLRPATGEYVADVRADTAERTATAQGMANADLMQKAGAPAVDPSRPGAMTAAFEKQAELKSKTDLGVAAGAKSQQAAELQQVLDASVGKESVARSSMASLAGNAVKESLADNEADYNSSTSTGRSVSTGLGAMASIYYNKDKVGKPVV